MSGPAIRRTLGARESTVSAELLIDLLRYLNALQLETAEQADRQRRSPPVRGRPAERGPLDAVPGAVELNGDVEIIKFVSYLTRFGRSVLASRRGPARPPHAAIKLLKIDKLEEIKQQ